MDKTKTKFYWTKKRKQQLKYWKIFGACLLTSIVVIGAVGTHTMKVIALETSQVTVKSKTTESLKSMVKRVAIEEDFEWVDYMERLINCESRWDQFATNNNGAYGLDRGLLQLNDRYHPEVTNEQAFNPEYSVRWAMQRIKAGFQKEWVCDKLI